jgi:hypothetical protein
MELPLNGDPRAPSDTRAFKHPKKSPQDELPSFHEDIWVHHILPFESMGHFAFGAGAGRQMKLYYKAYCDTEENPPAVDVHNIDYYLLATSCDTFFYAAFSSVTCAEYWVSQASKEEIHNINTCTLIAKARNLEVMKWAH